MENDDDERHYAIKGGKTIIGYLIAYQEKTSMTVEDIMRLPWLMIVLGMMDAPGIDFEKKKKSKTKIENPETAESQLRSLNKFFT